MEIGFAVISNDRPSSGSPAMSIDPRALRSDEPLAIELTAALKKGEVKLLGRLLAADSWLARCVVENPKGGGRTLLNLSADWPGHTPNAAAIVQKLAAAGSDLDAPVVSMRHRETPPHWAASNDDDVANRRPARRRSQYRANPSLARRGTWVMPAIMRRVEADPSPRTEALSGPFWNACHGGQLVTAMLWLGCSRWVPPPATRAPDLTLAFIGNVGRLQDQLV
jgi:hypothetical protein